MFRVNSESRSSAECRSCGSPITADDPILTKFQRCYYCGQHYPFGRNWTLTTVPVIIAAMAGLLAFWWTHLAS